MFSDQNFLASDSLKNSQSANVNQATQKRNKRCFSLNVDLQQANIKILCPSKIWKKENLSVLFAEIMPVYQIFRKKVTTETTFKNSDFSTI